MRKSIWPLLLLMCLGASAAHAADVSPVVTAIEFAPSRYLTETAMRLVMTETTIGRPFDAEALLADLQAIENLAFQHHGLQVFADIVADAVAHGDGVKIIVSPMDIDPDQLPVVAGFAVDIQPVTAQQFMDHFPLKPGQILNLNVLYDAIEDALDRLEIETGGLYLHRISVTMDANNVIHMKFRPVRVAAVELRGLDKTQDYVVRREIKTTVGELLNMHTVDADLRRLSHLRLFEDESLGAAFRLDEENLSVDVAYELVERKTGMVSLGAGYGTVDKLGLHVELADENLFGRGQFGSIRGEFGQIKSSYDVTFHDPNVAGTHTSAGFSLYNRSVRDDGNDNDYKEERSVGGNISVGKRLTDFVQASVRLRADDATNIPRHDAQPTVENRTRSVRISLLGDTTDRAFHPTVGVRYGAATEFALAVMGGDTTFTKYEANWSAYHQVGANAQVIALRLMGGFSATVLPIQDRFRVGGPDTVRAYNYGAARGDIMLVGNVEYRFKISDGIYGVVFADAGNAWNALHTVDMADLMASAGLGMRFDTALGPMRLDYGFGENGGRLDFSIGTAF